MTSLITASEIKKIIQRLQATAKMKADATDEAFLRNADPRAVQGGAIDEEASAWRELSRALSLAAAKCDAPALGD